MLISKFTLTVTGQKVIRAHSRIYQAFARISKPKTRLKWNQWLCSCLHSTI